MREAWINVYRDPDGTVWVGGACGSPQLANAFAYMARSTGEAKPLYRLRVRERQCT